MNNKLTKIGVGIAIIATLVFPFSTFAQVTTSSVVGNISSNLTLGSRSTQVTALQTFLATDPSVYPSGLVTGYFGTLTQTAVKAFQAKYGIVSSGTPATTGYGSVGPVTRAKINALMGGTVGTTSGSSPAINNVSVSATTQNAIVAWTTDRVATSKVYYGSIPLVFSENSSSNSEPIISGNVMTDTSLSASKQISLYNLASTTTYYYMVESIDANGNVSVSWPATFKTQ